MTAGIMIVVSKINMYYNLSIMFLPQCLQWVQSFPPVIKRKSDVHINTEPQSTHTNTEAPTQSCTFFCVIKTDE